MAPAPVKGLIDGEMGPEPVPTPEPLRKISLVQIVQAQYIPCRWGSGTRADGGGDALAACRCQSDCGVANSWNAGADGNDADAGTTNRSTADGCSKRARVGRWDGSSGGNEGRSSGATHATRAAGDRRTALSHRDIDRCSEGRLGKGGASQGKDSEEGTHLDRGVYDEVVVVGGAGWKERKSRLLSK